MCRLDKIFFGKDRLTAYRGISQHRFQEFEEEHVFLEKHFLQISSH
jgi:hypothetical protein